MRILEDTLGHDEAANQIWEIARDSPAYGRQS